MAKKIQLQDANGNVLHPLTLGECVAMDNGENLDTLMSKSQMFTPIIAQDKSMFKVGTGTDVDYSANVKDGAYESLVFKGKSLINIVNYSNGDITSGNSVDLTTGTITLKGRDGWSNAFLKYQQMKPSTKYLCWVNILQVTGTVEYLQVISSSNQASAFTNAWRVESPSVGFYKNIMTSETDLTDRKYVFRSYVGSGSNGATIQYQVGCVEYQEGMENWDIPCFTGIGSVKMPILQNVGKNLFDVNMTNFTNVTAIPIDGSLIIKKNTNPHYYSRTPIHLKPNTKYTFKCNTYRESDTETYVKLHLGARPHNDSLEYGGYVVPVGDGTFSKTFTTNSLGELYINGYTTTKGILLSNIQLEESSTATSYEDYKTNILRTSEEIVLREVNGVQDTYNPLTGEYVQRIKERVFNGSETWVQNGQHTDGSYRHICNTYTDAKTSSNNVLCDKMSFVKVNSSTGEGMTSDIHITFTTTTGKVQIATTKPLSELKTWLSQNPITVQYELVEPVTTIIKPSTMTPFAYQNGHVVVESGFEGQSLLPEIEYSVVTGRTGQVTQNTKVLRKQEQQIIGLEELLLTQVVQMEYERTLLQFDYELQMMMLG